MKTDVSVTSLPNHRLARHGAVAYVGEIVWRAQTCVPALQAFMLLAIACNAHDATQRSAAAPSRPIQARPTSIARQMESEHKIHLGNVIMQLRDPRGVSVDQFLESARSQAYVMNGCLHAMAKPDDNPSGSFDVSFDISPKGYMADAHWSAGAESFGSKVGRVCLRDALEHWRMPKPTRAQSMATLAVSVKPQALPVAQHFARNRLAAPPHKPDAPRGSYSRHVYRKLDANRSSLRHCFDEARTRKPKLAGSILLDFDVLPNGTVKALRLNTSKMTLHDTRFRGCVLYQTRRLRFDPHNESSAKLSFRYPYVFRAR